MTLLKWALICLLISLVAGAFGYTGLARGAGQLAKILFFLFLVSLHHHSDPGDLGRPARVLAFAPGEATPATSCAEAPPIRPPAGAVLGRTIEDAEGIGAAGASAFERPHPDDRTRLARGVAGFHVVKRGCLPPKGETQDKTKAKGRRGLGRAREAGVDLWHANPPG